ncbi:MBOAT, membrane-bound O-acyltransferase family-domain-containing protein [Spinellus fusiger]|nr:MBOAT, membrane-bound O-acyltransferase family-domain-containing protein [Spinellus fusiger]
MNPITVALSWATKVPEPSVRLLTTLILAYPVGSVYNHLYVRPLLNSKANTSTVEDRNRFVLVAGLALAFYYNGTNIYHTLVTTAVSYALCYVGDHLQNRRLATIGVWIFNSAYLLLGYLFTKTDEYDISWTMTQCILCLRLMGFSFDFQDGAEIKKSSGEAAIVTGNPLPLSFTDTSLEELPEFTKVLAFSLFPSAFLVGPQFSFSLYQRWLKAPYGGASIQHWEEIQKAQKLHIIHCVGLAIVYLGAQQFIGSYYTTSKILSEYNANLPFYKRVFFMWMAGATASFGISYNGMDKEGFYRFDGLANAAPSVYERVTSIDHIISSFNINTNLWSKYYVFKRMRFLGNKNASQFITLAFLAIWHGFHLNYFITFAMEYLSVLSESVLRARLLPLVKPYSSRNEIIHAAWKVLAWITTTSIVYYSVIGFDLLNLSKAWEAYKSVYFIGHFAMILILGANALFPKSSKKYHKIK